MALLSCILPGDPEGIIFLTLLYIMIDNTPCGVLKGGPLNLQDKEVAAYLFLYAC